MPSYSVFDKQPNEVLDYDVDYTQYFDDGDNDQIVSSGNITVVITPGNSVAPDLQTNGGPVAIAVNSLLRIAKVWLKGGVDGTIYKVTVRSITVNGRTIETDFKVRVKDL